MAGGVWWRDKPASSARNNHLQASTRFGSSALPLKGKVSGSNFLIRITEKGRTLFPLYHPAAALHNQSLRGTLVEDAKALKKALSKR